jgi:hypothetical protein
VEEEEEGVANGIRTKQVHIRRIKVSFFCWNFCGLLIWVFFCCFGIYLADFDVLVYFWDLPDRF